jgi:hypothetical protein
MSFIEWAKNTLAECDGCPSFGRVATAFTIFCTMTYMGAFLYMTKQFPSYDVILALAVLMTAPYGTNKMSEALTTIKDMIVSKKNPAVNTVAPGN